MMLRNMHIVLWMIFVAVDLQMLTETQSLTTNNRYQQKREREREKTFDCRFYHPAHFTAFACFSLQSLQIVLWRENKKSSIFFWLSQKEKKSVLVISCTFVDLRRSLTAAKQRTKIRYISITEKKNCEILFYVLHSKQNKTIYFC